MPIGFDKVMICNMALSHAGSKTTLESIDETNIAAKQCKLWYEAARIQTLEAFDWSFGRKSLTMAAHSVAAPTNRWAYRYQWPVDCVASRYIENPAGPQETAVPFEVESAGDGTSSVVTDLDDAVLIYTYDLSTVSLFSLHFVDVMSFALAGRVAYKLTGKTSLVKNLGKNFDNMVDKAYVSDGSGLVPRGERDAATIRARI